MKLPEHISPGAAARRSMLVDLLIAIVLAVGSLQLAAGLGVVGFCAILALLVTLFWIGVEVIFHRLRRRRPGSPSARRRHRRPA